VEFFMSGIRILCYVAAMPALAAPAFGEMNAALRLVQVVPLPGVAGRLDHMAVSMARTSVFYM
jgi:hypothetical protein